MSCRYSEELAREICRLLAEGEILTAICRRPDMPKRRTVYDWLAAEPAFAALYREARRRQLETWAEEMVELADGLDESQPRESLQRLKLKIEVRQWLIARLAPKPADEEAGELARRPATIRVVTGIERPEDKAQGVKPASPPSPTPSPSGRGSG